MDPSGLSELKHFRAVCRILAIDPHLATRALHDAKYAAGLRPNNNCTFDLDTGDIYFGD